MDLIPYLETSQKAEAVEWLKQSLMTDLVPADPPGRDLILALVPYLPPVDQISAIRTALRQECVVLLINESGGFSRWHVSAVQ